MENKEFCLQDIELLKQLQPIMEKLGIEPDKYFYKDRLVTPGFLTFGSICIIADGNSSSGVMISTDSLIGSWRRDKLEAALPEWCFGSAHVDSMLDAINDYENPAHEFALKNYERIIDILLMRGQKALNALAKLIILLDKEGLI